MMGLRVSILIENELLNEKVYWRLLGSNPSMKRYRSLKEYIEEFNKGEINE